MFVFLSVNKCHNTHKLAMKRLNSHWTNSFRPLFGIVTVLFSSLPTQILTHAFFFFYPCSSILGFFFPSFPIVCVCCVFVRGPIKLLSYICFHFFSSLGCCTQWSNTQISNQSNTTHDTHLTDWTDLTQLDPIHPQTVIDFTQQHTTPFMPNGLFSLGFFLCVALLVLVLDVRVQIRCAQPSTSQSCARN